jgi:hypothetical protein
MNNKASVLIYGLILGLTVIVTALALAPSVQDFTDISMNATNMDCSNESISNFDKAACIAVDLNLFYFIGALILIGGIIVTAKIIF